MRLRALAFDADEVIRNILKGYLDKIGYETLTFSGPGMCPLHELTTCPCPPNHTCADIILSDIDLPHIGGMEFIADQRRKGCKVKNFALMSGGWSIDELDQVATLDYKIFHKPFGFEELNNWFLECEKRIDPNRKLYNLFRKCTETHK